MRFSHLSLAALLLAAGTGLSAQDFRFGGQATLALPQGDLDDLMDGKVGYGLGAHLFIGLRDGHALVPRIDYTLFKRSEGSMDIELTALNLGADYNWFASGKAGEGFYALAGVAFSSGRLEVTGFGSDSEGSLAASVGAGFMFNRNLGAELRYTHAKYDDMKAPAIQGSFLFRF